MPIRTQIQLVLLKTRSQPDDAYEEYFEAYDTQRPETDIKYHPIFVPVLEHQQNQAALNDLGDLLRTRQLKEKYGGMIFTSQRAVEGWAQTVMKVEHIGHNPQPIHGSRTEMNVGRQLGCSSSLENDPDRSIATSTLGNRAVDERSNRSFITDIQTLTKFPLYTVGPATSRALSTLINSIETSTKATKQQEATQSLRDGTSHFLSLNPSVLGAHTGNGANLATFILQHYNQLQADKWFTFYEAPRLPFIPIVGMGSENYSRKRLEATDPRLSKKPLLFLVGEQRRDIIPKMLMNNDRLGEKWAIQVDEVEVYSTIVREGFRKDFDGLVARGFGAGLEGSTSSVQSDSIVVIVVFSPQGAKEMLHAIGYLDEQGKLVVPKDPERRWNDPSKRKYIIVTIGPTTREYLSVEVGFEPDLCASKPSPGGISGALAAFLKDKGIK